MVQSDLLKWTGRTFKRMESLLVLFLKYGQKFCHPSHMVIIHHYFKILLSLLWLPHPIFSKFLQPTKWNLFWIDNCFFFLEIGRSYMLFIIKFFGFFMPMSHAVNKRTPPSASTTSLPLSSFHQD